MSETSSTLELARRALGEMHIDQAIAGFEQVLATDAGAIGAHLGLYEALQVKGERERALAHQRRALARQRLFVEKPPSLGAPTMLMLAVPGDWQANVPLEYLYGAMSLGVLRLFVEAPLPNPGALPPCDVVFNAVAQSDAADPVLAALEGWLPKLALPVLNDPARVRSLTRDGVARDYADLAGAFVPATRRVRRDALPRDPLLLGTRPVEPVTLRPIDSHAGHGLERIERLEELEPYLRASDASEFFVAPFVDYRSADGFYRKYRIIFVGGVPFALHLAISDRWMVHYYNALNDREQWIRDEEAEFLADVENVFDGPRSDVLARLAERVGLDYFGIDCALLPDGRVLIFEIDVAMIVHLGDAIERYPYKHEYVPRIHRALEAMICARAGSKRGG